MKAKVPIHEALRGVTNEEWELIEASRAVDYVESKLNWLREQKLFGVMWDTYHPKGRAWKNKGVKIEDEEGKNWSGHMTSLHDPNEPIRTVTAVVNHDAHWEANRTLTISELKRACSFPDDFIFPGTKSFRQQWERLGRAVPPLTMYAIASHVRKKLEFIDGKTERRKKRMEIGARYAPYLMEDVRKVRHNGYKVISTFSGCGGSSLGYRMAGFKVLAASEFDKQAADTYEANFPDTPVLRDDIRELKGRDLLKSVGLEVGQLDVLDGSPPCASFSTAGKREKHWGEVRDYSGQKQRTDDLFWEFARMIEETQPRAFVGENVTGMVKGVSKGYFNEILALLRSKGYIVGCRQIDSSLLGVPQKRERIFFIGFREDLNILPDFPRPLGGKIVSVKQALKSGGPRNLSVKERGEADDEEFNQNIPPSMVKMLAQLKPGMSGSDITGGGWFSLRRLFWDKPCYTVQASHGQAAASSVIHPDEDRRLTIPELRRVCAFPDDFILTGDYKERFERLGRSVPPFVTRAIGFKLAASLGGA